MEVNEELIKHVANVARLDLTDDEVKKFVEEREVGTLIVGMPFLMDGGEGEEAEHVHRVANLIEEASPTCAIEFVDERETSKVYNKEVSEDRNAQAATMLLSVWLEKNTDT